MQRAEHSRMSLVIWVRCLSWDWATGLSHTEIKTTAGIMPDYTEIFPKDTAWGLGGRGTEVTSLPDSVPSGNWMLGKAVNWC